MFVGAQPPMDENDFKVVVTLTGFFKVRIVDKSDYTCDLEIPATSYRVLMAVYHSIGFYAGEPWPYS